MIRARLGGHPIHLMLVHFPAALYPMAAVCSSWFYVTSNPLPGHVSVYSITAGAAIAWIAALFGLWDAAFVSSKHTKIITTIAWHASLNGLVTILFTVWAVQSLKNYPELTKDSSLVLLLKWVAVVLLLIGNYFGGKLVLKYGVGLNDEKTEPVN
jgi:uncharacterized membrane protein